MRSIFSAEEMKMKTFNVALGSTAQGRDKNDNRRHYRTRLSSGKVLQVREGEPMTIQVNDVDASTIQNLASRGFLAVSEAEDKRPAAQQQQTAGARR
jgi:hypothetical protein